MVETPDVEALEPVASQLKDLDPDVVITCKFFQFCWGGGVGGLMCCCCHCWYLCYSTHFNCIVYYANNFLIHNVTHAYVVLPSNQWSAPQVAAPPADH